MTRSNLREVWAVTKEAVSDWDDHRSTSMAAAFAFYTLLSLAPLSVLGVSALSVVYGEPLARGKLAAELGGIVGGEPARAVEAIVTSARASESGTFGTIVGSIVLLFGASGMFVELQSSLNAVWSVRAKSGRPVVTFLRERLGAFVTMLAAALLLLASLVVSAGLSAVGTLFSDTLPGGAVLWQIVGTGVSWLVTWGVFAILFVRVPDVHVATRDAAVGAAPTAALFTLGKWALGVYLARASFASAYGAAGSLVALVVWVYYSAQIVLLGAEVVRITAKRRGAPVLPEEGAELVPWKVEALAVSPRENSAV
jgi:membrane protein